MSGGWGGDLGTVPEGFGERLAAARIFSYRVLLFEKNADGFAPPDQYPALALAVAGSHDLPTLRAWWTGEDLDLKERLGLFPQASGAGAARLDRSYDREDLLTALRRRGFCKSPTLEMDEFIHSVHAYLGSSTAALAVLQMDDLTGEVSPVNVPTTSHEHPNWRRRLSLSLEQIAGDPLFDALCKILNSARAAAVPSETPRRSAGDSIWTGTYRLQLHEEFPLDAAREILPYLKTLGISHVYLSPCLKASDGSKHGYDVTDASKVSEDLGGEPAWARFVSAAQAQQIRILLDIVPNHMAASAQNHWWDDVLAQGPYSEFSEFFDLRIPTGEPFRLQLCTLARSYGDALRAGELQLELSANGPRLKHFDNSWPLSAASWCQLLGEEDQTVAGSPLDTRHFARLIQLQQIATPTPIDRESYRQYRLRAESQLRASHSSGELAAAVKRVNEDPTRCTRCCNSSSMRYTTGRFPAS